VRRLRDIVRQRKRRGMAQLLSEGGPVAAAATGEEGAAIAPEVGAAGPPEAEAAPVTGRRAAPKPAALNLSEAIALWSYSDQRGREWAAVGVNRSELALWLRHELGVDVEAELAAEPQLAPLSQRRTHRRLRQLWHSGRLLLKGSSLSELAERGAGRPAESTFQRELAELARCVGAHLA
jgi:hypothetical protein